MPFLRIAAQDGKGNALVVANVRKKRKALLSELIFCVPHQKAQFVQSHTFDGGVAIRIPRGKYRTELLALGLCAKLEASPAWTDERIRKEMSDFFLDRFQPSSGNTFQFFVLDCNFWLEIASKSKSKFFFCMSGNALQHLGRSTIYIIAHEQHRLKCFPVQRLNCDQNPGNGDDGANIEEPNASNFRSASNNEEVRCNGN